MPDCDGYFDDRDIAFIPENQDLAVSTVMHDPNLTKAEKKRLIQCWFDVTYGSWNGSRFDLQDSRTQMASWLRNSPYATFEDGMDPGPGEA
jgi:hypothetical protein